MLWLFQFTVRSGIDWLSFIGLKFTEKPHQAQEVLKLSLIGCLKVLERKRSILFVSSFPLVSYFLVAVGSQVHCLAASQPQQGLSACACPPVSQEWLGRGATVTEPELGDLLLLITAFTALQRLCVIGALYATKHYFSLIASLSKIAGDHLRQCWNRNSGSADWSLCILTDHAFQNETPVYEIRLKSR